MTASSGQNAHLKLSPRVCHDRYTKVSTLVQSLGANQDVVNEQVIRVIPSEPLYRTERHDKAGQEPQPPVNMRGTVTNDSD